MCICVHTCVCARVCVCVHMRLFRGSRHPFLHLHGARLYFRHSVCCVPSLQFADHWRLSPPLPWGLVFFQRETLEFSRFHSRPLTQITNLGLAEQLLSWSRYYFLDFFFPLWWPLSLLSTSKQVHAWCQVQRWLRAQRMAGQISGVAISSLAAGQHGGKDSRVGLTRPGLIWWVWVGPT